MRCERSLTVRIAGVLALAASAVFAASCGGSSDQTTVTAPTGTVVTDTFNGTLNPPVNGVLQTNVHMFTVTTAGGSINITLLSAGPPATIQVGMGLGNPSATGTCSLIPGFVLSQTSAGSTAQLSGTGAPAGAYCVAIGDIGNVLQAITYTITVAHT
jgi:hypothetical protein